MASEGWNVGSVTVRRVRLDGNAIVSVQSQRHGGDVAGVIRSLLAAAGEDDGGRVPTGAAISGPLAAAVSSLPYVPEPICVEHALRELGIAPDIVLSLGGKASSPTACGRGASATWSPATAVPPAAANSSFSS